MRRTTARETLDAIAPYYDGLMQRIDYRRWEEEVLRLEEVVPGALDNVLEIGCGTGRLAKQLRRHGVRIIGCDWSERMVAEAVKKAGKARNRPRFVVADMRALPFHPQKARFTTVVALFDTVNFLRTRKDLDRLMSGVNDLLCDGGIFLFDVVTERNILNHFADSSWQEISGGVKSSWRGRYTRDRKECTVEISIDGGPSVRFVEHLFTTEELALATRRAGFSTTRTVESYSWREVSDTTERISVIAIKG